MLEKKKVYHEAGHAVIARLLGAGVTHIAMFSTRDDNSASAQTVSLGWATKGQDPTAYEKDALIALAGPITQHRFQPVKNFDCAWQNEWHDDGLNARGYVARAYLLRHGVAIGDGPYSFTPEQYKDIDAVLDRLERQATELVQANWPAIERVVEALLKRPLLNQDELDALIVDRPLIRW